MATSARKNTPKRPLELADYLQKILTARVYDVAIESPLEPRRALSARLDNQVCFKREDTQPVFSFKLRGAYNKMAHLSPAAAGARRDLRLGRQPRPGRRARRAPARLPGRGRDAGDHAALKVDAVRALGGEVVLHRRQLFRRLRAGDGARGRSAASPSSIRSTTPT